MIRIDDYPQLKRLCWFRRTDVEISEEEAFSIYLRNYRHLNLQDVTPDEKEFMKRLEGLYGRF